MHCLYLLFIQVTAQLSTTIVEISTVILIRALLMYNTKKIIMKSMLSMDVSEQSLKAFIREQK